MNDHSAPRAGMSHTEIAVAVLLVGLLAALVAPSAFHGADEARYRDVIDDFQALERGLVAYYTDVGTLTPLDDIHSFGSSPRNPAYRHFITGDDAPGWDGPYLERMLVGSRFGGLFDIDVFNPRQASIDLGTRSRMGERYEDVLEAVDELLDGDGDLTRGRVWGDSNGIHVGFNYVKE